MISHCISIKPRDMQAGVTAATVSEFSKTVGTIIFISYSAHYYINIQLNEFWVNTNKNNKYWNSVNYLHQNKTLAYILHNYMIYLGRFYWYYLINLAQIVKHHKLATYLVTPSKLTCWYKGQKSISLYINFTYLLHFVQFAATPRLHYVGNKYLTSFVLLPYRTINRTFLVLKE